MAGLASAYQTGTFYGAENRLLVNSTSVVRASGVGIVPVRLCEPMQGKRARVDPRPELSSIAHNLLHRAVALKSMHCCHEGSANKCANFATLSDEMRYAMMQIGSTGCDLI